MAYPPVLGRFVADPGSTPLRQVTTGNYPPIDPTGTSTALVSTTASPPVVDPTTGLPYGISLAPVGILAKFNAMPGMLKIAIVGGVAAGAYFLFHKLSNGGGSAALVPKSA
jgi:hypothetical protein